MNFLPLGLFAAGLLFCLVCHLSVLYALAFGYVVFFTYGRYCRLSVRKLLSLSWQGIRTIRMVLIVFGLIGLITATWRASGTIPFLVYEAGQIISIVVSLASVAIACNQPLSSIMVQDLCQSLYDDKEEMALALEDTTIVLAALVPWSVAAAVPLAALGASSWGIAAAVYLYLQSLWSWLRTSFRKREQGA